jgi:hypothetical protein
MEPDNTQPQHPSQGEAPRSELEVTVPPDAGQDTSKTESPVTQDEDLKSAKPEVDTPYDAAEGTSKVESPVAKVEEFKSSTSEEIVPHDVEEGTGKIESPIMQDQDFISPKSEPIVPHGGGEDTTKVDSPASQEFILVIEKPKVAFPNGFDEDEINCQSRFSEDTESVNASSAAELDQGYRPNIRGLSYEDQRYIPTQKYTTNNCPGPVSGYPSKIGGQSDEDYHQNMVTQIFTTSSPLRPLRRIPKTRGLGHEDSDEYHQYLAKARVETTPNCSRPVPAYYPKTRGLAREDYDNYHQYRAAQGEFAPSCPGLVRSYSPKTQIPNHEDHQNIATQTSTSHSSLHFVRSFDLDESYYQPENNGFHFRSIGISLIEVHLRRGEDGRREWSAELIGDKVWACSIM